MHEIATARASNAGAEAAAAAAGRVSLRRFCGGLQLSQFVAVFRLVGSRPRVAGGCLGRVVLKGNLYCTPAMIFCRFFCSSCVFENLLTYRYLVESWTASHQLGVAQTFVGLLQLWAW